jgi:hypothetical protein
MNQNFGTNRDTNRVLKSISTQVEDAKRTSKATTDCNDVLVRVWVWPGGTWHLDMQERLLGKSSMSPTCIVLIVDSRIARTPPTEERTAFIQGASASLPPSAVVALGDNELLLEGSSSSADLVCAFASIQQTDTPAARQRMEAILLHGQHTIHANYGGSTSNAGDSKRAPSSPIYAVNFRACANPQVGTKYDT